MEAISAELQLQRALQVQQRTLPVQHRVLEQPAAALGQRLGNLRMPGALALHPFG